MGENISPQLRVNPLRTDYFDRSNESILINKLINILCIVIIIYQYIDHTLCIAMNIITRSNANKTVTRKAFEVCLFSISFIVPTNRTIALGR